jgi:hypothetical protein
MSAEPAKPIDSPFVHLGFIVADRDEFLEDFQATPFGAKCSWAQEVRLAMIFKQRSSAATVARHIKGRSPRVLELWENHSHYIASVAIGPKRAFVGQL